MLTNRTNFYLLVWFQLSIWAMKMCKVKLPWMNTLTFRNTEHTSKLKILINIKIFMRVVDLIIFFSLISSNSVLAKCLVLLRAGIIKIVVLFFIRPNPSAIPWVLLIFKLAGASSLNLIQRHLGCTILKSRVVSTK